jgi:hypothetical protein
MLACGGTTGSGAGGASSSSKASSSSSGMATSTSSSTSAGTSTSSSSSSGSGNTDCFDYSTFNGASPAVSFKTDVVPIFAQSCALSTACHGCDAAVNPACKTGTYTPFLGVAPPGTALSTAQIAAIIASTVGQPAVLQISTLDGTTMVGNPDMSIVKAGNPAASFMTYKLDGNFPSVPTMDDVNCPKLTCAATMTCGLAEPSAGTQLPAAQRDVIRRWIAQGAQNN